MLNITEADLMQLAGLLLDRAGLKVGPDGFHSLRLAMAARMPALGLSDADDYVRRLKGLAGEHELRSLLPLVTVGHTEFFRDPRQFRALERKILPDLLARVRKEGRRAQIWSAGCATGEEPFSLAVLLRELGAESADASIWATDLNPVAVETAQAGRFPPRRMATVSTERRARFFTQGADGFEAKASLKQLIQFEGLNLAAPVFAKLPPGSMDLILCRNVIIYFDLATIRGLMDRFLQALRPHGFLLLGYSESLFRVYDKFEMVDVEGSFIYRRPQQDAVGSVKLPPEPPTAPARRTVPLPDRGTPLKARALSAPTPRPAAAAASQPAPRPPATPPQRMAALVQLLEEGRFEDAAVAAQALAEEDEDLNGPLTLGNIYALMGKAPSARDVFQRVLQREPLCVEARVYGGLAAFQVGQFADARAEFARALFLEPTLAVGHFLLAQVEERAGEKEAARRAYRNAIAQLRFPQRPLAGFYPDLPESAEVIGRAARYALAALEER